MADKKARIEQNLKFVKDEFKEKASEINNKFKNAKERMKAFKEARRINQLKQKEIERLRFQDHHENELMLKQMK